MSWFNPADGLSVRTETLLKEMAESGSSENSGVADILNTIASNSPEQATDVHMLCCAAEIRDAADAFIKQLKGKA